MAIVLYELGGLDDKRYSLFSWRARMALAHKGLLPEYRPVHISDKAAIAFSGQAKVPIIVDGETTVFDSWRIAEYLEATYADAPTLFGGAIGAGVARFLNSFTDRVLIPAAGPLVVCHVVEFLNDVDAAHLRAVMEKAYGITMETMRAERDARVVVFRRALDPVRATLRNQPFICGAAPAYGDYIVFSVLQWARIGAPLPLLEEADPIHPWMNRMLDLYDGLARREPARAT